MSSGSKCHWTAKIIISSRTRRVVITMKTPDFSKIPRNPVRELREEFKMSSAQLARATNLSPHTIRDIERGLTTSLPEVLIKFFAVQSSANLATKLSEDYDNWKYLVRSNVFLPPVGLLSVSSMVHPFTQYRERIGVTLAKFCDWLCLPRFVIKNYEDGKQKKMPVSLRNFALPQAHLSTRDVVRLANLGVIHYEAAEQRRINDNRKNIAG